MTEKAEFNLNIVLDDIIDNAKTENSSDLYNKFKGNI